MDKKIYKRKAEQELTKAEKGIMELEELTKPISPENAIGRISRMDAINNRSVNAAALRTLREKAKKIQSALQRINESDFGICGKCKKAIPDGRLLLLPEATLCVNCA